jgi:rubrerythrin
METSGQEYYLKAGRESNNELGKKLLESLSTEETIHRQKFEEIYNNIRTKKAWLVTNFQPDRGKRLRTIFAKTTELVGSEIKPLINELDVVQTAISLENKTRDFYKSQGRSATHTAERDFYETLVIEEREHSLILLDYFEYLKDPAGWFVSKEHPSLDGS